MLRLNEEIKKISKQFVKFSLIGFFNTFVDFSIYIFLTRTFFFFEENFVTANVLSFIVAATNSFILNRNLTFKGHHSYIKRQYVKFIFFGTIGLVLNSSILYLLVELFDFYDIFAKAIAVCIVLFWNFGTSKFYTFKKIEPEKS